MLGGDLMEGGVKIQFFGAAQTVTGSCFMIEACGIRFFVDCGMHQGNSAIEARNFDVDKRQVNDVAFVLLTHAHIDHSGLLPKIVHDGFHGAIYCTPPTADLVGLMLEDSAHIQEIEAEWKRKKQDRHSGQNETTQNFDPLYTVDDAHLVPSLLKPIEYDHSFEPYSGIKVTYRDAGHILGSAFLEIVINEKGTSTRLLFSGDLGRPGTLLMHDPELAKPADYLFMESTYGDRNHKNEAATLDELAEAIAYSYSKHDKVIIPAFAVGRTQEILYCLYLLRQQKRLPPDMPIFVDSPLAIRATEVFKKYQNYLDVKEADVETHVETYLPQLKFTLNAAESQALNSLQSSAIIISASGMCNAGRIKHHLRHNVWKPGVSLVFVGYQGIGTPGRKIVDGAKTIRLLNEDVAIRAKVFTIGGFSAHAGQSQLLDWLGKVQRPGMQVVLVHGEKKAQDILARLIHDQYKLHVSIPSYLEEMILQEGTTPQMVVTSKPAQPHVNWNFLLGETEHKINTLKGLLANVADRPWEEQMDIKERILDLNKELLSVLSNL